MMSESPGAALPKPQIPAPRRSKSGVGRVFGRLLLGLLRAIYPLSLIVVIVTLSGLAFWYLVDSLLFSPVNPPQIADLPALKETELSRSSSAFAGVQATENSRIPLAHYHRFGPWFQADAFNDCTRSGCHGALPHHKRKESRAFLNLHATSIHCGVCHMTSDATPLALTWYDLKSGGTSTPPAALRAMSWLDARANRGGQLSSTDKAEIVALLKQANESAKGRDLDQIVQHLHAIRHDSPDLPGILEDARTLLQEHLRGEYGVKLALQGESGVPLLAHPGGANAATRYLATREQVSGDAREKLLNDVHTRRAEQPRLCTDCHTTERSLIDFAKLGYPAARVHALTQPLLMSAIQKIMQGKEFHLPGFVGQQEESDHR